MRKAVNIRFPGSGCATSPVVDVEVPVGLESHFYKNGTLVAQHKTAVTSRAAAGISDLYVLMLGSRSRAAATLHMGTLKTLQARDQPCAVVARVSPVGLSDVGKVALAETPVVKADIEAFTERATLGWTSYDDEVLINKAESLKLDTTTPACGSKLPDTLLDRHGGPSRCGARLVLLTAASSLISKCVVPRCDLANLNSHQGKLIGKCRRYVQTDLKRNMWDEVMRTTYKNSPNGGSSHSITFNRDLATKLEQEGLVDHAGTETLFGQCLQNCKTWSVTDLRVYTDSSGRAWSVNYSNEPGQDAGGLYREAMDTSIQELQTSMLPLLCKTPNNRSHSGELRECWMVSPSATRASHKRMLQFLGQMIGLSLRTKGTIPLVLHPMVWKYLTGEERTVDDLRSLDESIVTATEELVKMAKSPEMDADTFESCFFEMFTTHSSASSHEAPHVLDLKPNGASTPLTFDNVDEWAELVIKTRLHEADEQLKLVKQGLATVVPVDLLSLWTGHELEHEVCGSSSIDVDILKRHVHYDGYEESSPAIGYMWQALESWSDEDRSDFLHFAWGRSRLPATEAAWALLPSSGGRLKITRSGLSPQSLPIAHTCFFQIEMPEYTSVENASEKLLFAVRNCRGFAFG